MSSAVYIHVKPEQRKVLAILDADADSFKDYVKAHEFVMRDNGHIVPKYKERIIPINYKCKSVKRDGAPRFSFGIKKLVAPEDALWYIWREKCLPIEELLHASKAFKAFAMEFSWAAYPYKMFRLWGCNVDAKQDIYSVLLFSVYDNMYSANGDSSPENPKYAPPPVYRQSVSA